MEMTAELSFRLCGGGCRLGAPLRRSCLFADDDEEAVKEDPRTDREVQHKRKNSDKKLPTHSAHQRRAAE